MSYIPFSSQEQDKLVKNIGLTSIDDLFKDIPESARVKGLLNLPDSLSEMELVSSFQKMAAQNKDAHSPCFLGAGAYDHYIPSIIQPLISRGEFLTAYTPYQPEASQGTLQYIFEFQSIICELTGMDVANASMYDGSSASAEAALMACRCTDRNKVLVSRALHPQYREVIKTYLRSANLQYEEIPLKDGVTDLELLSQTIDSNTAAVMVQYPNFLGNIEDMVAIEKTVHAQKSLLVVNAYPIALGKLKPPAEFGTDICVMEGQSLGNSLSFGGPYLGIITCKKEWVRKMPGRLVGLAKDNQGREGFILTLQAREQHIRRAKATSNICSNQSLNALCSLIYLVTLGKKGFRELWDLNYQKAHYAASRIAALASFKLAYPQQPFFNEFCIHSSKSVAQVNTVLKNAGILGGYALSKDYPELDNTLLFCVTEKRTRSEIDHLVEILAQV